MKTTKATIYGLPDDVTFDVVMLGQKLGRVVDASLVMEDSDEIAGKAISPIREDDIVRLSHDPADGEPLPTLTEVVFKARPRVLSEIDCKSFEQVCRMIALAAVLRAEIHSVDIDPEYVTPIRLLHADGINLPAIARAAGVGRSDVDFSGKPCHLSKIRFFGVEQEYLMIAMAIVLGAEIIDVTYDTNEIVLFHPDGVDIAAVADAARISVDREDIEIGAPNFFPRPGAVPGAEWDSGQWASFDSLPRNQPVQADVQGEKP